MYNVQIPLTISISLPIAIIIGLKDGQVRIKIFKVKIHLLIKKIHFITKSVLFYFN